MPRPTLTITTTGAAVKEKLDDLRRLRPDRDFKASEVLGAALIEADETVPETLADLLDDDHLILALAVASGEELTRPTQEGADSPAIGQQKLPFVSPLIKE